MQTSEQCAEDREYVIGMEKNHISAMFKGKGDMQEFENYTLIKLLPHTFKLRERVMNKRLNIRGSRFGFMARRSTTDAIF